MHHRKNFIVAFVYYYSCTYEMLNWLKEGWFNVCSVQCIVSVFHLDFIVFSFEAIREMRENSNIIQWSAKKTNNLKLIYSYHSGSIESSVSFDFSFLISTMKTYTFDKDPLFYEWIQFELMLPTPIYALCGVVSFFLFLLLASKYLQFDSSLTLIDRSNRSE